MKRLPILLAALLALLSGPQTQAQTAGARERAAALFDRYAELRRAPSVAAAAIAGDPDHYLAMSDGMLKRHAFATEGEGETLLSRLPEKFRLKDYARSAGGTLLVADGAAPIYRHSYTTDYYLVDGETLAPLAPEITGKRDASFSPDGRTIAFSSGNDLWLYDLATRAARRITFDGEWNAVINGTADWVYEEEFGFTRAYAFSPDGRQIAYLRFDERDVPMFEMMRFDDSLYNRAYAFKYPKAGERNSTVSLHVYDLATGATRRVPTGGETDQYLPHIGWTPAGDLYFYRDNRRQNLFEVVVDRNGEQRTVYRETSPRYVERPDAGTVIFLDGDRFLVREETTDGWWHLFLHSIRDGRLRQLTSGRWEVTRVVAADDRHVWYLSTEQSPLRRDLYRIDLRGRHKQRLTEGDGWHTIQPGSGMKYYIESFSSSAEPGRIVVRRGDGTFVRELASMEAPADAPRREFFTWVTERGDTLNAYLIRPRDFDPAKRYPVLLTQYSGPGSQEVADRWRPDWCDVLAGEGYLVACTDGRGTGFRGEAFKKQTYGDLGHLEREDQLSFARHLAAQPYVDPARIGIYGWSFGGFMSLSCALKGDGLFRAAVAVAPVTSWRYYDTIYTETYNGLPGENAAGYDDNSPLNFRERLSPATRLLLIHGTADDNVHFQNTVEMARRLNAAGAQYDMMIYPDQNHSMMPRDTGNVRRKMIAYLLENL